MGSRIHRQKTPAALRLLVLLLAVAAPSAARAAFTWEACDADAAPPFTASDVALTPDPPVIGSQVAFAINGTADRDVEAGTITMSVAFAGVPIYEGTDDLCAKTTCPIRPGPVVIDYRQDLPPVAPPGDYDVSLRVRDAAGTELLCVTVHFSMVPPSSSSSSSASSSASSSSVATAATTTSGSGGTGGSRGSSGSSGGSGGGSGSGSDSGSGLVLVGARSSEREAEAAGGRVAPSRRLLTERD